MAFPVSKRFDSRSNTSIKKKNLVFVNLTSLIDMFIIIIIFLLKTYVNEGKIPPVSNDLILPKSVSMQLLKNYGAVILLTRDSIYFQDKSIYSNEDIIKMDQFKVDSLFFHLIEYKEGIHNMIDNKKIDEEKQKAIKGLVTIIGHKNIPYSVLKKIIYTCYISGFNNVFLATEREKDNKVTIY